ncbi:DNA alkylation repair protein, partial [Candidatus Wolfebacteria bacterium]|nr:DNA alkylation repair protein [Candidatus Wolfebacteria bacterium]
KSDPKTRKIFFRFYLKNTKYINNWDLVDLSSRDIIGAFLDDKPKNILYKLARSKNLWERRIAIVSTYHYVKQKKCGETLKISKILLNDKHDLIHKAVGWMLREVGKNCSEKILEDFLKPRYKNMPRTMLRYAIEKFPENKRKKYLQRD